MLRKWRYRVTLKRLCRTYYEDAPSATHPKWNFLVSVTEHLRRNFYWIYVRQMPKLHIWPTKFSRCPAPFRDPPAYWPPSGGAIEPPLIVRWDEMNAPAYERLWWLVRRRRYQQDISLALIRPARHTSSCITLPTHACRWPAHGPPDRQCSEGGPSTC